MNIRNFQPGDEAAQVAVYNTAAAALPKFKPATIQEVQRRVKARDFDEGQRFYAEKNGQVVGYCNFSANGRVSFPWCLPGHEAAAAPLFAAVVDGMKARGMKDAFAAYRGDWPIVANFFLSHDFHKARDMINYLVDIQDGLGRSLGEPEGITPVRPEEAESLFAMAPEALRVRTPSEFREHLFNNPYFKSQALFASRAGDGAPQALGILITEPTYADPKAVDPAMPCFRLGAFGTETMQVKRLRGLFSFLASDDETLEGLAVNLWRHALLQAEKSGLEYLAAQAPSDAPTLVKFYERLFERQGSFPVFERKLS